MNLFDDNRHHSITGGRSVTVYRNKDCDQACSVSLRKHTTVRDIIQEAIESLGIKSSKHCKLVDAKGYEIDNDDVEFLDEQSAAFITEGEEFNRMNALALYQEIKVLGQGGFGTVKLYRQKTTGAEVAVKFQSLSNMGSPEEVQQIFQEIQLLRELKHPNIVALVDVLNIKDSIVFLMEFCSGGEVQTYVEKQGPMPEDEVYSISTQLTDAVRYCHNSKVIHRDLKLENMLFTNCMRDRIKVCDFGIAGMFSHGPEQDHSEMGSIHYIAPEVISGENTSATPALDVWSIGVIVYAMLTGVMPFDGPDQATIAQKVVKLEYKKVDQFPNITKPWNKLVSGCLRRNPKKRWEMIDINRHLFHYKQNPNEECGGPSDEEKKEEEVKVPVGRKSEPQAPAARAKKSNPGATPGYLAPKKSNISTSKSGQNLMLPSKSGNNLGNDLRQASSPRGKKVVSPKASPARRAVRKKSQPGKGLSKGQKAIQDAAKQRNSIMAACMIYSTPNLHPK